MSFKIMALVYYQVCSSQLHTDKNFSHRNSWTRFWKFMSWISKLVIGWYYLWPLFCSILMFSLGFPLSYWQDYWNQVSKIHRTLLSNLPYALVCFHGVSSIRTLTQFTIFFILEKQNWICISSYIINSKSTKIMATILY